MESQKVWLGLANELLARPDLRETLRNELQGGLRGSDPDQNAKVVRATLAKAFANQRDDGKAASVASGAKHLSEAKQARRLLEHGLKRVAATTGELEPRLVQFLEKALATYTEASRAAGSPPELETAEVLVGRALDALAQRTTRARQARIGVLNAEEIARVASGALRVAEAATVVSSGDFAQDLKTWQQSEQMSAARRQQVASGDFVDGALSVVVVHPTLKGQSVEVHPLSASGRPTNKPVARYSAPKQTESVGVVRTILAPAVTEPQRVRKQTVPKLQTSKPRPDLSRLADVRQAAVAANQVRIALYAEILKARSDLKGAARQASERRLERMQLESHDLADSGLSSKRLEGYLKQWSKEITRDLAALSGRASLPSVQELFHRQLNAISRMGALQSRLNNLHAMARGSAPGEAEHWTSSQSLVFAMPDMESRSIFDSLGGPTVAGRANRAEGRSVAGEKLASQVMIRDAGRATRPARSSQRYLNDIAKAGKRLRQALTNAAAMAQTGLGLSSKMRPLLRPDGMPSVIRPDTKSPILRHLLLPAMERVSGPKKAFARTSGSGGSRATPEQLYGALLGGTGLELIDKRPELAKNLLGQMGTLSQRLDSSGTAPTLRSLQKAGTEMRERLTSISGTDDDGGGVPQPTEGEVAADVVGESAGLPVGGGADVSVETASSAAGSDAAVSDVAGELAQEGTALASALKERIEPFVSIGSDTKIYSGKIASAALDEMGALGASVGSDIYVHRKIMKKGGVEAAAVVGHEAVHAQRSRLGQASVETEEEAAYKVESQIRESFQVGELAKEQKPDLPGVGEGDPTAESEKEGKTDVLIEDLAEMVSEIWGEEASWTSIRYGR